MPVFEINWSLGSLQHPALLRGKKGYNFPWETMLLMTVKYTDYKKRKKEEVLKS